MSSSTLRFVNFGNTIRYSFALVVCLAVSAIERATVTFGQEAENPVVTREEREGIVQLTRQDGTQEFIRPDGTKQVRTPNGTVVTYFKDGRVATQTPEGEVTWSELERHDPNRSRNPSSGDERRPRTITPEYGNGAAVDESSGHSFTPRNQNDDRQHADWREFEKWVKSDEAQKLREMLDGEAGSGTTGSNPAVGGTTGGNSSAAGNVPSDATTLGDGTRFWFDESSRQEEYLRPDGTRQTRKENGTVFSVTPRGDTFVQYPEGDPIRIKTDPTSGTQQYPTQDGQGTITVVPGFGTVTDKGNGGKRVEYEGGGGFEEDGNGGKTLFDAGGNQVVAQVPTDSGDTLRYDNKGNVELISPAGEVIAKGSITPGAVPLVDITARGKIAIVEAPNSASDPSGDAPQARQPNIFEKASQKYRDFRTNPDMLKEQQETLNQERDALNQLPQQDPVYATRRQQYNNRLNAYMETIADIKAWGKFIEKNAYNPPEFDSDGRVVVEPRDDGKSQLALLQVSREQAELETQKQALDAEQASLNAVRNQLVSQQKALQEERAELSREKVALDAEKSAIEQEQFQYNLDKVLNDSEEARLDADLNRVVNSINYNLYNYCPNGAAWSQCDHPQEKREWLNDQMDRLLGPGYWDRFNAMSRKKGDLEQKKEDLDYRRTKLGNDAVALAGKSGQLSVQVGGVTQQLENLTPKLDAFSKKQSAYKSKVDELKANLEKYVGE